MEDFNSARNVERSSDANALRAEWMEDLNGPAKLELARGKSAQNAQDGPGKAAADRIDGELKQFANQKNPDESSGMQAFKQLVNKFEDNADKSTAIIDFGQASAKIRVGMEKDANDTYNKMESLADNAPGRKALQADLSAKQGAFFDKISALPSKTQDNVLDLVQFKPGESHDQRDARVREGLHNRPALLASFNKMEDAYNKIEAAKSPQEKQLESEHLKDVQEARKIWQVVSEASIRSQIKA